MLGSILLLTLITVIAIVLSVSARNRPAENAESERLRREEAGPFKQHQFRHGRFLSGYSEIPETGIVYPVRQSGRFWTNDEVERYWINPRRAGLDTISEKNDSIIFKTLGINPDREAP